MFRKITTLTLTACAALSLIGCVASIDGPSEETGDSSDALDRPVPKVAAGGTFHYSDMFDEWNSDYYRSLGGLLFMHNSGWGTLNVNERQWVHSLFQGPRLVELSANGDNSADWANVYQKRYLDIGTNATIACINFLGWRTTDDETDRYIDTMRGKGLELVVPVFAPNSGQWQQGSFTKSPDFAGLRHAVERGGGIATDAPPAFYYSQPSGYQNFIIDMIKWTNGIGRKSIVIISPNASGGNFLADTQRFVAELERRRATPDYYVVQNYLPTDSQPGGDYPNRIGTEDDPNNILGVATWLQEHVYQ